MAVVIAKGEKGSKERGDVVSFAQVKDPHLERGQQSLASMRDTIK